MKPSDTQTRDDQWQSRKMYDVSQTNVSQGCRENRAFTQKLTEKLTSAKKLSLAYFPYGAGLLVTPNFPVLQHICTT